MMRRLPLVVVCVMCLNCSSPTSPSITERFRANAVTHAATVNAVLGGLVTVDIDDRIVVTVPASGAPWHESVDRAKLIVISASATQLVFEAKASTGPFWTVIALTDDQTWQSAADTPLRRYYLVQIR